MAGNRPLSFALGLAASVLSPPGRNARLQVLIYHRVLPAPDPLCPGEVDAGTFRWHMRLMARYFNVLPLSEALERLQRGALPARAACITFDDGYRDNLEIALPVLREFGLPATFFIATGFLNGGVMWNDRVIEALRQTPKPELDLSALDLGVYDLGDTDRKRQAIQSLLPRLKHLPFAERADKVAAVVEQSGAGVPGPLMMSDAQVMSLRSRGMEIGAHTVGHPILARLVDAEAEREIADSKSYLEALLNEPVNLFAYPNGKPGHDYGPQHVEQVRRLGFTGAVSTAWGVSTRRTDHYQLRRFTPWDKTPARFLMRLIRNSLNT